MVKYTLQRIMLAIITAIIILTLTFFLMKQLPFYPVAGTNETKAAFFESQVNLGILLDFPKEQTGYGDLLWYYVEGEGNKTIEHYFYLKPALDQYIIWVKGIFTSFSWGRSLYISPNVDSMVIIMSRLPNTIKVNLPAVLISVPTGIALGVLAALKKNTWIDYIISTIIMVFISVPSFITITVLLYIFAFQLDILPATWPSESLGLWMKIKGFVLPTLALSFGSICGYARAVRAELTEVMSSDFLLLARTKGLTRSQAIVRHAMKNAMVPILPSILSEVIGLLGGAMILETLYGINGVGKLYTLAISMQDYNVLMADMALYTIIGLLSGVFLDLSYGFIDPRIRMGARK